LSLFNRPLKTKSVDDAEGEESTDAVFMDLEIESQLDMLETEINGDGLGDEDPEVDSDDDEIAGDVATSDAAAVTDVIRDAEASIRLDPLPPNDANLGRVSIAKVSTS